jgi:hypothetical protein
MGVDVRTRGYKITVQITNPGAVTNLQITAPATRSVVITHVVIKPAQAALVTDAGARVRLGYKTATATGLVSVAVTSSSVVSLQQSDADSGMTIGHSAATTEGTDGDSFIEGWRSLDGLDWFPTPEEYISFPGGGIFMIKHEVAPPVGVYSFEITAHEIG